MPSKHSKRRRRDKAVMDISALDDIPLLTEAEAKRLVLSDFNHSAGIQREIALVPKSGTRLERAETQARAIVEAWDESASESGLRITATGAEEFYPDARPERYVYVSAKDLLFSVEKLKQECTQRHRRSCRTGNVQARVDRALRRRSGRRHVRQAHCLCKADGDIDAAIERAIDIGRDAAILERWTANDFIAQSKKNRGAFREGHERKYGTADEKEKRWAGYQVEVDRLLKAGQTYSNACKRAAKKFGVCAKTIQRRTTR